MADFSSVHLGDLLGGWHHNQAAEYKSSNSNYRVYKPEVSPTAEGGLFISCTMDHIRGGAKDDHAFIKLNLNNNCKPEINTGLLKAASVLGGIAGQAELATAAIFVSWP